MNIGRVLAYMYPNANPRNDYKVMDHLDGQGQQISQWNLADPQPTQEELEVQWLYVLRKDKIAELKKACNLDILSGFTATNGHTYEFTMLDQTNMDQQHGMLLRRTDILSVNWQTVDSGEIPHTREEFFKVVDEASDFKWSKVFRYRQLKADVIAATTESEINAIVW